MTSLYFGDSHYSISPTAISITSRARPTATLIIDKRALFREGLRKAISGSAFTVVSAEADLGSVRWEDRDPTSALLIILASSHDPAADVAAVATARTRFPGATVVSLCQHCSFRQATLLLRAGTSAILPPPQQFDGFVEVLDLVLLGQHIMPQHLVGAFLGAAAPESEDENAGSESITIDLEERGLGLSRLSAREVDIVRCLRAGEPNRSIAQRLMICEATVKVHVKAILRKIKVKNRTQAAIWAVNNMGSSTPSAPSPVVPHLFQHLGGGMSEQHHA